MPFFTSGAGVVDVGRNLARRRELPGVVVLLAAALGMSGCIAHGIARDLSAMRTELIRLNDAQIVDNAIRWKNGEAILQLTYNRITGEGTWEWNNQGSVGNESNFAFDKAIQTFQNSTDRVTYALQMSAKLTGKMNVEAAPVGTQQMKIIDDLYEQITRTISEPVLADQATIEGLRRNPNVYRILGPRPPLSRQETLRALGITRPAESKIPYDDSRFGQDVVYCVLYESTPGDNNAEDFKRLLACIARLEEPNNTVIEIKPSRPPGPGPGPGERPGAGPGAGRGPGERPATESGER